MVYRKYIKNRKYTKKVMKKGRSPFKSFSKTKRLISLINKVSLKKCETKHTHQIGENQQLYHNIPKTIISNVFYTEKGVSDNGAGLTNYACRVGEQVIARGLSIKLWFANKLDRPNVMYVVRVFKYYSATHPPTNSPYLSQGSTNVMLRDFDTESYKLIKSFRLNLNQGTSERIVTVTDTFEGAEGHAFRKIYIPLKDKKFIYMNEGTELQNRMSYGVNVTAYDSYGTPETDNIASVAYNVKFYFKDP